MTHDRLTAPETEVSDALHRATEDLAPSRTVIEGGMIRARRTRRRRRGATALGGVAAAAVIAAGVAMPSLLGGDADDPAHESRSADGTAATGPTTRKEPKAAPQPSTPNRPLAVAADDIPATVADLVPGEVSAPVLEAPYGVKDEARDKIAHFSYDGMLLTIGIEPANSSASCTEFAEAEQPGGGTSPVVCTVRDGVETLWDPQAGENVPPGEAWVRTASVWRHGYVVSAVSYNSTPTAARTPAQDAPPLTQDELFTLVESTVWFDGSGGSADHNDGSDSSVIAVAAAEIPETVETLSPGDADEVLRGGSFGFEDDAQSKIASFRYEGTLMTVSIAREEPPLSADQLADIASAPNWITSG